MNSLPFTVVISYLILGKPLRKNLKKLYTKNDMISIYSYIKYFYMHYLPAKLVHYTNNQPFLAWCIMALPDFSFYFLIKNVVAVMVRFLKGRSKKN
jgi:hypothetical protein